MANLTDVVIEVVKLAIWNVCALVSLAVALVSLGGALADWEYLRERRINGLRELQAWANLRNQSGRALVSLLFLLIGVLAIANAPWLDDLAAWLLIAASLALTASAVLDWSDRRRMIRLIIALEAKEGHRHEPRTAP